MIREDVYNAIFGLVTPLATSGLLQTTSRRLEHVEDVPSTSMPAMYQNQVMETPFKDSMSGAYLTQLDLEWYVYVATDPNLQDPSTPVLNPIVDALVALLPGVNNPYAIQISGQTCNFSRGKIQYFEGLLGAKAIAKIELSVIVPFA